MASEITAGRRVNISNPLELEIFEVGELIKSRRQDEKSILVDVEAFKRFYARNFLAKVFN